MNLTPILADGAPSWQSTVAVLSMCATGAGMIFSGLVAWYMKRQTDIMADSATRPMQQQINPQPLAVEVVKAIHEQFAGKEEFRELVKSNTERHGQLFKKIEVVEREAREGLQAAVAEINTSRAQTMERLTGELTFIRESIVELKTEIKIRNEQ